MKYTDAGAARETEAVRRRRPRRDGSTVGDDAVAVEGATTVEG